MVWFCWWFNLVTIPKKKCWLFFFFSFFCPFSLTVWIFSLFLCQFIKCVVRGALFLNNIFSFLFHRDHYSAFAWLAICFQFFFIFSLILFLSVSVSYSTINITYSHRKLLHYNAMLRHCAVCCLLFFFSLLRFIITFITIHIPKCNCLFVYYFFFFLISSFQQRIGM